MHRERESSRENQKTDGTQKGKINYGKKRIKEFLKVMKIMTMYVTYAR